MGLVFFLKRFRCYLEAPPSEVSTDNQFMKDLFVKLTLNLLEARWLELFAQFCIVKVNLNPGRVHVLAVVHSRAPHVIEDTTLLNSVSVSTPDHVAPFPMECDSDPLFVPIVRTARGTSR